MNNFPLPNEALDPSLDKLPVAKTAEEGLLGGGVGEGRVRMTGVDMVSLEIGFGSSSVANDTTVAGGFSKDDY